MRLLTNHFLRALTDLDLPTVRRAFVVEESGWRCVTVESAIFFGRDVRAFAVEPFMAATVLADSRASCKLMFPATGGVLMVRYFMQVVCLVTNKWSS